MVLDDCWYKSCSWYILLDVAAELVGGGGGSCFGGDKLPPFWCFTLFPLFPWLLREEFEPEWEVVEDEERDASIEPLDCWALIPNDSTRFMQNKGKILPRKQYNDF